MARETEQGDHQRKRPALPGLAVLTALVLGAIGLIVGLLLRWAEPPSLLNVPAASGNAPVTQREFDDARSVTLSVVLSPLADLRTPVGGRLTASECAPGASLASGSRLLEVDGVPLIGLATTVPLWRDLAIGDAGADVAALSAELQRLGRLGETSQTVTRALVDAFNAAAQGAGVPAGALSATGVARTQVVWLPAATVRVAECAAQVGEPINPDQVVASLIPNVAEARLSAPINSPLSGDRVLNLTGGSIGVPADGVITDAAALAQIATSAELRAASQTNSGPINLAGRLVLQSPLPVSVVPPGSLVPVDGTAVCVVADGAGRRATLVGSQLGQSYVTFEGAAPTEVQLNPPPDTRC